MQAMLKEKDREEQEKRFEKTWIGTLVISILLLVLSALCMGAGGLFLFLFQDAETIHSGIALMSLGLLHIPLAIWGISISKKRQADAGFGILIYDSGLSYKVVLACLWLVSICALAVFLLSVLLCIAAVVPGIIFSIMSAAFFFWTYYLFAARRNTRVVLQGTTIEQINAFGRRRVYDKTEIKRVLRNAPIHVGAHGYQCCGWEVYGQNDKKLFTLSETMVNFPAVEPFFEGKIEEWQEAMEWKTEQELAEASGSSFQRKHLKQIQIAAWILFAVDLLLGAIVVLIYRNTDWIKMKYYFLIMELLPLTFFLFAWMFRDVVVWDDDSGRYLWVQTKKSRLKRYVNISVMMMMLILCNLVLVIMPLTIQMVCIKGSLSIFFLWVVYALILILISFGCVGKKRLKLYTQWFFILFFSAVTAWGMTDTTFFFTSKAAKHYAAEVVKTGESHSYRRGTSYYVVVMLKDGAEQRIRVAKSVYQAAERGESLVICEREGILDTEFVTVHLP
ncbi:MAG: hypothetical protein NC089_11130 [Bacteroides sp.]|nr:hypothetical protein [Bacteroides sp.]MCM1550349.1 hypothetical protein [Clostridium sp.]